MTKISSDSKAALSYVRYHRTMESRELRARVVALGGDIDYGSSDMLRRLAASFASYDVVVLDVRHVHFADTTFVRFLIQLKKAARPDVEHPVRLVAMTHRLRRLLEITGLMRSFAAYDSVEVAIRDAGTVEDSPLLLVS